ncbi:uncharacterized protein At1g27050 [Malania oleifera]|uniref:uncharacterized protein At1g27050 n=1 Tax=Malania oleifera TaxID=397392 RepID=UPI0025AE14B2|nr:uncharacterized protein At1g27050 [Malania oleifera]
MFLPKMSRKRDKPYLSRHAPTSTPKRRRPPPPPFQPAAHAAMEPSAKALSAAVLVIGLPLDCSVLDLKSRFEIYGCVSRIRIERDGLAYITFRSKSSAEAAIAASLDPSFGINLYSKRVQVVWTNDPLPSKIHGSSSKLLRAEVPLSRRGRGNKLGSRNTGGSSEIDVPYKGREIVAYDDVL